MCVAAPTATNLPCSAQRSADACREVLGVASQQRAELVHVGHDAFDARLYHRLAGRELGESRNAARARNGERLQELVAIIVIEDTLSSRRPLRTAPRQRVATGKRS
jgi:hypothetical protein